MKPKAPIKRKPISKINFSFQPAFIICSQEIYGQVLQTTIGRSSGLFSKQQEIEMAYPMACEAFRIKMAQTVELSQKPWLAVEKIGWWTLIKAVMKKRIF